ncbi:MAG: NADH-quinone oxidoreductase subunit J [Planctomycetota bacterium]
MAYGVYLTTGVLALSVYVAMPKDRRPGRPVLSAIVGAVALGALVALLGRLLDESSSRFYTYLLALLAVLGAIRVVTHARPVYSALYFILVVLSTAGLLVLSGAEFLAAALVIVYAGAILVTYVFVIMMAQPPASLGAGSSASGLDCDRSARKPGMAVLAGFVLMATLAGVIVEYEWPSEPGLPGFVEADGAARSLVADAESVTEGNTQAAGNTMAVGRALLGPTGFVISMELAGVLLTVAMVGAVAIARRRLPRAEDEIESPPIGEIGKHVKPF